MEYIYIYILLVWARFKLGSILDQLNQIQVQVKEVYTHVHAWESDIGPLKFGSYKTRAEPN